MYDFFQGEIQSHAVDRKSTNPFDLPNDSDLEHSNMVCYRCFFWSVKCFELPLELYILDDN